MADNTEIILNIIEFHHTIRERVNTLGGSVSDLEALFSLRGEYANWTQTSLDKLVEQQKKLQETFSSLENGLQEHFDYEEKNLPAILGEIIMQGLLFEHRNIRQNIAESKSLVFDTSFEGKEREEIVLLKTRLQQVIDTLNRNIEKHAAREEIILDMAREGLENN